MIKESKFFEDKSKKIDDLMKEYGRRSILLSVFRFVMFVLGVVSIIVAVAMRMTLFYFLFAGFMIVFTVLCIIHGKVASKLSFYEALGIVNSKYIARIKGDFDELSVSF